MTGWARRAAGPERMDAADLDPATYQALLADLARVNGWTLARPPTLRFVAAAVGARDRFRLLDVGYGQGDMLRAIARWAVRAGKRAELVGVDLNPRSAVAARAATPAGLPIDYRTGDYHDQPDAFDLVVSSLVAHHMDEAELVAFLRFMEARAGLGWLVNDLHRHRLAHALWRPAAAMMRWHPIVRADGALSIRRSLRAGEWPALLLAAGVPPHAARVRRRFPFRLCVERRR